MRRMLDFKERSRMRRIMYAKPTILALGALTVLVAHGAWDMYQKSREAIDKRDKTASDLATVVQREQELQNDISRLSTERGQEEEIRDRFMVAKSGEKVIIVPETDEEKTHTVTVNSDQSNESLLDKFKAAVGISNGQ